MNVELSEYRPQNRVDRPVTVTMKEEYWNNLDHYLRYAH